jgi:putative component of membrane protein insertase Oxa1/YidC/SpoIIIJ protein YidD
MPSPLQINSLLSFALLAAVLLAFQFSSGAQTIDPKTDLQLADIIKCKHKHRQIRPFIYANQPVRFKTHNPVSLAYGGLLFVYQNAISPHFSADCLYHPGCSDFSKQAVKELGFFKGGLLSVDRLNRCNRVSAADIHPSVFDPKTFRTDDPVSKYK